MTSHLGALCFDANDPERLLQFWAGMLGREIADGNTLLPSTDKQFPIVFLPADAPKTLPNQIHFDLTSTSLEDQQAAVARALELGGRHIDIGQGPHEGHVVLADPEGNEFCVIEPDNNFLAGTEAIGALSSDGTQRVGYFWTEALGWPLVWDQDEETAIQAPTGTGSKISWGGPPVREKPAKNRLHLDLVVDGDADGDLDAEVARLLSLGATRVDATHTGVDGVALADPDGNEFCVLPARR